jgi:hypothetical protein
VDRDGESFFGVLLADDVLVEIFLDFPGGRQFSADTRGPGRLFSVLQNYVVAQVNTVGADINLVWAFDEGVLLGTRPAAEAAYGPGSVIVCLFRHLLSCVIWRGKPRPTIDVVTLYIVNQLIDFCNLIGV